MGPSPPDSSFHGILQARTLEWVAMSSSRGIFPTQGLNPCLFTSPALAGEFFTTSTPWAAALKATNRLPRPCTYSLLFGPCGAAEAGAASACGRWPRGPSLLLPQRLRTAQAAAGVAEGRRGAWAPVRRPAQSCQHGSSSGPERLPGSPSSARAASAQRVKSM